MSTTSGPKDRLTFPAKLLAGILAVCPLMVAGPAKGGQIVPLTIEEMSAVADDVVHVKVLENDSEWYRGKLITRNQVQVLQSMKGNAGRTGTMELVTLGGDSGKLSAVAPGLAKLEKNEELILFLQTPSLHMDSNRSADMNLESPLINSPQIIGGFQGKFTIVRDTIKEEKFGRVFEREEVKVMRPTPGMKMTFEQAPTLASFKSNVSNLVDPNNRAARVMRKIETAGEVAVPVKDPTAATLRAFDPLPAMAQKPMMRYVPKEVKPATGTVEEPASEEPGENRTKPAAAEKPASDRN